MVRLFISKVVMDQLSFLKIVLTKVRGALYFNQNAIVRAENNDTTWLGAGIVVNGDKTVQLACKKSY